MNEFENYMVIREKVDELIATIDKIQPESEQMDNLDYAIMMLVQMKSDLMP